MNMFIKATTKIPNVVIDYLEVKLSNNTEVSLTWRVSNSAVENGKFSGLYEGVVIGEDEQDASSCCSLFDPGMKIIAIGLYSGGKEVMVENVTDSFALEDLFLIDKAFHLHLAGTSAFKN